MYAFINLDRGTIIHHSDQHTCNVPSIIKPTMWPSLKTQFQVLKHQFQTELKCKITVRYNEISWILNNKKKKKPSVSINYQHTCDLRKRETYLDIKKPIMPTSVSSGIFVMSIDRACAWFSLSSDNYSSDEEILCCYRILLFTKTYN